jgi:ribose transport system substrate-binding protein
LEEKMKKIYFVCFLVMVATVAFAGGNKDSSNAASRPINLLLYFPAPHAYFVDVQKGVDDWVKETGISVHTEYGSDWTVNSLSDKVSALVATGYNAISIYPLPGVNGLYDELTSRNVKIVNWGADISTSTPRGTDTNASFCLATDVGKAAYDAANIAIDRMGGSGTLLCIYEVLTDPNTVLRQEAVQRACIERNVTLRETAGIEAIDAATQKAADILNANPDAKGIITTGMIATQGLVSVLNGMNRNIVAVGIDTDEATLAAIERGVLYGTIAQNPLGQGYLSCELLKHIHEGAKPRPGKYFIDSGTVLVTRENLGTFNNDINAVTQRIKGSLLTEYLTK